MTEQPEIVQVFLDWLREASPAQVLSAAPLVLDAMVERGVNVMPPGMADELRDVAQDMQVLPGALVAERLLGLVHYRGVVRYLRPPPAAPPVTEALDLDDLAARISAESLDVLQEEIGLALEPFVGAALNDRTLDAVTAAARQAVRDIIVRGDIRGDDAAFLRRIQPEAVHDGDGHVEIQWRPVSRE